MEVEQPEGQLKNLSDPFDLESDPYLARGPTGTFHCKKCLTTHPTEANYIIHRNGRRHKAAIDRSKKYQDLAAVQRKTGRQRAEADATHEKQSDEGLPMPKYTVDKVYDASASLWTIKVTTWYPGSESMPTYRLMSVHEQKVDESKDPHFMFLAIGCIGFKTIALRVPNSTFINKDTIYTSWHDGMYVLLFVYSENTQNLRIATR